jgi:hypothetical protein
MEIWFIGPEAIKGALELENHGGGHRVKGPPAFWPRNLSQEASIGD